jgi:hypothetical protein
MPSEKLQELRIVMRQHKHHGLFIAMAEVLKLKAIGRASVVLMIAVWSGPAWTQTHDTDFPEQMAAVNRCYVAHIKSGRPPVPDPWADKEFWDCMEAQGFKFCGDCQIFRYSGGLCRNDKKNGPDRPTCWRPIAK